MKTGIISVGLMGHGVAAALSDAAGHGYGQAYIPELVCAFRRRDADIG